MTVSPRSSLARLDLRSGHARPLAAGRFFAVANPSLSPSGRLAFVATSCAACRPRLAVVRGRDTILLKPALSVTWINSQRLIVSVGRGEETDLWVVSPDGRGHELEWLTEQAEEIAVESERELVLSPNRRTLLFSGEGASEHHGNYIVDLRKREVLPLSGDANDAPAFSPDGRTIAYQHVARPDDWDICVARISLRASSGARCFRSPAGNDREPVFLPNGRQLVFSSDRASRRNGINSLYVLDLAGGSVRRLTWGGYDAISPRVTPDGRSVIFVRRALVRLSSPAQEPAAAGSNTASR